MTFHRVAEKHFLFHDNARHETSTHQQLRTIAKVSRFIALDGVKEDFFYMSKHLTLIFSDSLSILPSAISLANEIEEKLFGLPLPKPDQ